MFYIPLKALYSFRPLTDLFIPTQTRLLLKEIAKGSAQAFVLYGGLGLRVGVRVWSWLQLHLVGC